MGTDGDRDHDAIDESLLECYLELSLKERIQSAANFANAVERLRGLGANLRRDFGCAAGPAASEVDPSSKDL
jgi:hypothetical protein